MPQSHHSHSGQFCGHAKNNLEEVIQAAIAKGFHSFALTEHIPREPVDFYPEEVCCHDTRVVYGADLVVRPNLRLRKV